MGSPKGNLQIYFDESNREKIKTLYGTDDVRDLKEIVKSWLIEGKDFLATQSLNDVKKERELIKLEKDKELIQIEKEIAREKLENLKLDRKIKEKRLSEDVLQSASKDEISRLENKITGNSLVDEYESRCWEKNQKYLQCTSCGVTAYAVDDVKLDFSFDVKDEVSIRQAIENYKIHIDKKHSRNITVGEKASFYHLQQFHEEIKN